MHQRSDIHTLLKVSFPDISPLPLGIGFWFLTHGKGHPLPSTSSVWVWGLQWNWWENAQPQLALQPCWGSRLKPNDSSIVPSCNRFIEQCHPIGRFMTWTVWFFRILGGKRQQFFTAGYLLCRDNKQKRCASPAIIFIRVTDMKCCKSFKMHWEVRLQHWPAYMTKNTKAVEVDLEDQAEWIWPRNGWKRMEIPKAFRTSTTLKHEPASSQSGILLIYRQHEWSWFIGIIDLIVCKISTGGFPLPLRELLLC